MIATPLSVGSRRGAVPGRAVTGVTMLALAASLCGVAVVTDDVPKTAVVWGASALGAYAAGLLLLIGGADPGLARWKVGSWILLWYGLAYGVASTTWAEPQVSTAAQISLTSVLRASWLVAIGITAWAVGYAVGPGRPLRRLAARGVAMIGNRFSGTVRSLATPWILYSVGMAARLATVITTGRFGYVGDAASTLSTTTGYGQILSDASIFAPLAVAAAALQVFGERRRGARATLVVLFLAEIVFGAAAGGKGELRHRGAGGGHPYEYRAASSSQGGRDRKHFGVSYYNHSFQPSVQIGGS